MAAPYEIYPAVDKDGNFPEVIREAMAQSPELKDSIEEEVVIVVAASSTVTNAAAAAVGSEVTKRDLLSGTDPRVPRVIDDDTFWRAFADAQGRVALGIRKADGTVEITQLLSKVATLAKVNGWANEIVNPAITGYIRAWVDSAGRIALGLRPDGTVFIANLDATNINVDARNFRTAVSPEPNHSTRKASWNPALAAYNAHDRNLMKWRAAWSRAMSGQGTAHISAGIDSITFGIVANPYLNAWPKRLYSLLAKHAGYDAGTGFTPLWDLLMASDGLDPRWTRGGTWTSYTTQKEGLGLPAGQQGFGVMGRSCARIEGVGWWQFAPTGVSTQLSAYFVINTDSTGTATLSVDGNAVGTVDLTTGAVTGTGVTVRTTPVNTIVVDVAVTSGVHNLRVTVAAGGIGYLIGMEGSTSAGVKVSNLGRSGAAMSEWSLDDPNKRFGQPWESDIPKADLQILMPIMNDRNTPVNTLKESVRTAVRRQRSSGGDAMLVCPAQPNFSSANIGGSSSGYLALVTAMYELADEEDLPLVDMAWAWKDYDTTASLGYFGDNLHPNRVGLENIADRLSAILAVK